MSTRTKGVMGLLVMLVFFAAFGYATKDSSKVVADRIEAYRAAHPPNNLDLLLGLVTGAVGMMLVFVGISIYESIRFERQTGGGKGGPGGTYNGGHKIRLPMSRKVIDIRKWTPTDGKLHRGMIDATT